LHYFLIPRIEYCLLNVFAGADKAVETLGGFYLKKGTRSGRR